MIFSDWVSISTLSGMFDKKSWTLFGIFVPNGGLQSTILKAVWGKNGFHFHKSFQKFGIFSPN